MLSPTLVAVARSEARKAMPSLQSPVPTRIRPCGPVPTSSIRWRAARAACSRMVAGAAASGGQYGLTSSRKAASPVATTYSASAHRKNRSRSEGAVCTAASSVMPKPMVA
ncbi:MAG: hypothetical protein A2138_22460 [Deltaproteobacteria bacterium RBG_16_71_12]|nr:MAG: hypothetical protein A2138_22460 [Deltaproteobacteria bacterium RBG_16_71_12]